MVRSYLEKNMQERIMVIDGAMGTTIQQYKFSEEDFRGERWKDIDQATAADATPPTLAAAGPLAAGLSSTRPLFPRDTAPRPAARRRSSRATTTCSSSRST